MNFPISCYAGIADNGFEGAPEIENPKALKAKEQWYSCNLYPRGIEGERNIPAETKQWIKWRLAQVDVSGGDDSNVLNAASNISFRSVNVEFKSAIPQPTYVLFWKLGEYEC